MQNSLLFYIVITLNLFYNIYNDFIVSFIKKCKGFKINFISFNLIEDVRTYKQLNEILKDTNIEYEIIFNEDPQKIFREVDKCDLLISMRFHGCLFAYHNKVPFIPLCLTFSPNNTQIVYGDDNASLVSVEIKSNTQTTKSTLLLIQGQFQTIWKIYMLFLKNTTRKIGMS